MSNNPYEDYSQMPDGGTPFVDPYQPRDRQPVYPPAVTRSALMAAGQGAATGGASRFNPIAQGGGADAPAPSGSKMGAVACLVLAAFLVGMHAALLAVGVAAIFRVVARSEFTRAWATNAFNFIVTYLVLTVVVNIVLWVVDSATHGGLRNTVGTWMMAIWALTLLAGAFSAWRGGYFRLPLQAAALAR